MSGHSKWATTKHKKAIVDAKRGKLFTKLAKLITIAARDGKSGDVSMNPSLRMAVDNAKASSLPKDNIERAIKKGTGEGGGAAIEEVTYEAYAPNGVPLLIQCLTDNRNRTLGEIKALLNKYAGSLASPNSVSYQFKKTGQIIIDEAKNTIAGDEMEMAIIDSGALDFEKDDGLYIVTCNFSDLHAVAIALSEAGVVIQSAEPVQVATTPMDLPEEKVDQVMNLVEKIEDLDDVSDVFTNLNL